VKKIDHILAVIDKPKHDQVALGRAMVLHRATGARLHLVAFAYHPMYDQRDVFDAHQRNAVRKSILKDRLQWLRGQVPDAGGAFSNLTLEVAWSKHIAGWVNDAVAERGFDFVVKSGHRSETLVHTPTDWALLRTCPAPVMIAVARGWPTRPKVLATLDLGSRDRAHQTLNRRVLAAAHYLAEHHHGQVHCVYAIEIPDVLADLDIIDRRKAHKRAKDRAAGRLGELLAPYDVPGSRIHMPAGKVGAVVNGVAAKIRADIMVMGTTARRGAAGLLIGNSAEKVLSKARCDVLALKP